MAGERKKSKTKKPARKSAAVPKTQAARPRRLKTPKYKTLRLNKRIKPRMPKLPNAIRLFGRALRQIQVHWKLFVGILAVYGFFNLVLVKGFTSQLDLSGTKTALQALAQGHLSQLSSGLALFGLVVGSAGTASSDAGTVYQGLLVILASLALIWALRQTLAKQKITIKQTFYQGMYPFIPFLLVLLVIGLQLIPLLAGDWIFSTVISNGLAITGIEKILWGLIFLLLALLTLYMICSSLFALYIVTLPNMTPMKALRSARQLVLYRRWVVLRKILFLPLALIVLAAVIEVPVIILVPATAEWVFFVLTLIGLAVTHSYMYGLYRELL